MSPGIGRYNPATPGLSSTHLIRAFTRVLLHLKPRAERCEKVELCLHSVIEMCLPVCHGAEQELIILLYASQEPAGYQRLTDAVSTTGHVKYSLLAAVCTS